jgi:predicted MPP superfamily phosphohydrolase
VESESLMRDLLQPWADKLIRAMLPQHPFDIRTVEIPVPDLPPAFHGFRVVQISDLHIDRWNRAVAEASVDAINRLDADLLVCTGDNIANGPHYLSDMAGILGQLNVRLGKLACLGNHDYSDGSGSYGVRKALKSAGFDVLVNESTTLTVEHQHIQVAGADDLILGSQCLRTTHRCLSQDPATLLLSHNPENFEAIAKFRPELVLSGHTHGGQIYIPEGLRRRFIGFPYVAGLYAVDRSRLYVNRGLGSAVFVHHWDERRLALPTPRFLVRPEISVFVLVNARQQDPIHLDAHRVPASTKAS